MIPYDLVECAGIYCLCDLKLNPEELYMERKNAWKTYDAAENEKLNAVCSEYSKYLDNGKTERECVTHTIKMAEAKGYRDMNKIIAESMWSSMPAPQDLPTATSATIGTSVSKWNTSSRAFGCSRICLALGQNSIR